MGRDEAVAIFREMYSGVLRMNRVSPYDMRTCSQNWIIKRKVLVTFIAKALHHGATESEIVEASDEPVSTIRWYYNKYVSHGRESRYRRIPDKGVRRSNRRRRLPKGREAQLARPHVARNEKEARSAIRPGDD